MKAGLLRVMAPAALAVVISLAVHPAGPNAATPAPVAAGGWVVFKFPQPAPACTGAGFAAPYWDQLDCGFGRVKLTGASTAAVVQVEFVGENGATLGTDTATGDGAGTWEFNVAPAAAWTPGKVTVQARVDGTLAQGTTEFFFRQLGGSVAADTRVGGYRPGDSIPISGRLYEQDTVGVDTQKKNVPGRYSLRVVTSTGAVRGPYGPFTANKGGDGLIRETLPPSATAALTATKDTNYETTVRVEVVNASYTDLVTGAWKTTREAAGNVTLSVPPPALVLENTFVSAVGWVKPGETYPFRVFVKNFDWSAKGGAVVKLPAPDGTTFTAVTPTTGSGTASIANGTITWNAGTVPARTDVGPGLRTLVVEAKADTLTEDKQIVWKNLSSTATLTYTGGPVVTDVSKGPKVIPPRATFDTARYGSRPFPVVPVDFRDRAHAADHSAERLLAVINSPDLPGSTYNLYQEMSYGQLFPHGTVPSAAIATACFDVQWQSQHRRTRGFAFSQPAPGGACYGTTLGAAAGTPLYGERIRNGWYELPGDTAYYGGDADSFANVGVPNAAFIDNACGSTGKAVYDAALAADPEIDYSDYDTDKDGVVDFFMMVFPGAGGNGASQLSVPPYDNIWPHSSSLENGFRDPDTGQLGYVSDDQLRDNEGRLLYYTDASRGAITRTATQWPVYVRVGPNNVNPESAMEKASVISHEYGHSLGLPDYYSNSGNRETYGDWNLMATDKSQNMDVNGKQELGWIVPRVLQPGETTVNGWHDSKANTHRIDWLAPDGTAYSLSGPTVQNGEAYVAKLPGKQIIDPATVQQGGSGTHVWWSQSGNDFGCAPTGGHNFDVFLPQLATVPAGTPVTVTFKSRWDIEWDYDYGFVLTSTDGGKTYASHASQNLYTTPGQVNPNQNSCQQQYGNGITGSSGSYAAGTFAADRNPVAGAYPDAGFIADSYDLGDVAGKATVLRFSYSTDPGLARPGWFIDDVVVKAGDQVLYSSDFESGADEPSLYNGGCKEGLGVAGTCTAGWQYVAAGEEAVQDHAYYLELRDRSGFDFNGKEQVDRAPIGFIPGLLLVYTDEAAGYGNTGEPDTTTPNQTPLDAVPQPGEVAPNLDDAAFTAAAGRNSFSDVGWVDNYGDEDSADGNWHFDFGCLSFQVLAMSGDDIGPDATPGNLTGDVRFTLGSGCGAYDYGVDIVAPTNVAPTAVAQAKPTTANVNQRVRFDGSASYDAEDASSSLTYEWDFDGNGTWDATGSSVAHKYTAAGTFTAALRVTDTGGKTGTATLPITVR